MAHTDICAHPTDHLKDRRYEPIADLHHCSSALSGSACGQDQASQLLETAQFEERQTNLTHAKELYEDILRQYPDSPPPRRPARGWPNSPADKRSRR